MMTTNTDSLRQKFYDLSGTEPQPGQEDEALIGFFQNFRPDGTALDQLFAELEVGEALQHRLALLYLIAGEDRRPGGGRDAYFLVRNPPELQPQRAEQWGEQWLKGIRELAAVVGDRDLVDQLDPLPSIRVLEGIAPKHPRAVEERSQLLLSLQQDATQLVDRLDAGPYAPLLRQPYYFTACDPMLRDYLMWPLYAEASGLEDPLEPYFQLWRHGVKYRVFGEAQVDLYLPRQPRKKMLS